MTHQVEIWALGEGRLELWMDERLGRKIEQHIYPAKEIIFTCHYNRNETETVLADQLKQASGHKAARLMHGTDCVATALLGINRDPAIHHQGRAFGPPSDPMICKLKAPNLHIGA
ncbi:MAG: hypothetical protein PHW87_09975 [Methanothrix sp.]|nr:hypothetical protein [Methanothrix sp.]